MQTVHFEYKFDIYVNITTFLVGKLVSLRRWSILKPRFSLLTPVDAQE